MPTITKLFTMEEAAQHNTNEDCWVVIDGKVYDVSSYLDEHPGGDDVLLKAAGIDATEGFEDAGHSKTARELLEQFCIGELDEPPPPIPELEIVSKKQEVNDILGRVLNLSKENWAVPVAVVGLSVAVGFLYLRKK
ncbi:cytochrome b5 isoform a [Phtheirospermum japonicum]|uniref:Cytochrome b5 isoform a n=1 Tax=Phtheirospermum japonicum TaxID=374723 RepID=A0A830BNS3_9LAMI|nr:cytochrome b5 isoform a [Phtheirospermum japonicum]